MADEHAPYKPYEPKHTPMFIVVPLHTREGLHVINVRILPYKHMPEAILWGERLFMRRADNKYYEGFCHVVVNLPELPPDLHAGNGGGSAKGENPGDETKRLYEEGH